MDWRVLRGAASVDRMLALMVLAAPLQAPPSAPPSVVVILMDDIGRDKVGAYADHADAPPTPHLDALAARGVLFRNAWAYPVCSPTRAALLTGRHSDRTGIGAIIESADGVATPLPFSETILPEALPDHASVTLGKWHLRDVGDSDLHPVQSGFDAAAGYVGAPTYFHWTTHVNGVRRNESGYFPSALARRGTEVLGRLDEPFFLYYASVIPHLALQVPREYVERYPAEWDAAPYLGQQSYLPHPSPRRAYAGMISFLDDQVGRILDTLEARGVACHVSHVYCREQANAAIDAGASVVQLYYSRLNAWYKSKKSLDANADPGYELARDALARAKAAGGQTKIMVASLANVDAVKRVLGADYLLVGQRIIDELANTPASDLGETIISDAASVAVGAPARLDEAAYRAACDASPASEELEIALKRNAASDSELIDYINEHKGGGGNA